jgi:uncharacterized protein YuzB (UPF0349 family)
MLTIGLRALDNDNEDCMFSKYSVEVCNIPFDISTLSASDYDLEHLTLYDDADLPSFDIMCWCQSCTENEFETWISGDIISTAIGPKQEVVKSCDRLIDTNYHDDDDDETKFLDSVPVDAISAYYSKFLDHREEWGSTDSFPTSVHLDGCYCTVICHCSFRHPNPYGSIKM